MLSITEYYKEKIIRPEKILCIGEGNFIRAFVCFLLDLMNEKQVYDGSAVLCQPIEEGKCAQINSQNGLYTVIERGMENGMSIERARIISSVSRCINPYKDFEAFLQIGRSPNLEVIISNTTEAGIAFKDTDKFNDCPHVSYPGKLTRLLFERFSLFGEGHGLLILPVELIDQNGKRLKECVNDYIKLWNLPDRFKKWIESECFFADTLVDRIVSGYPSDDEERLRQKLGYFDSLLDTAEPFFFWAIEAPKKWTSVFPADKSGLSVVFSDDISSYKKRKVRILNCAHTLSVLAAFLAGHDTVYEMMCDKLFENFIRQTLSEEIIPFIELPLDEMNAYAQSVLERFRNSYLEHRLLDISLNSVSKYKARCLPSAVDCIKGQNSAPDNLAFALGALIKFYQGEWIEGKYYGKRNGQRYEIRDDREVLKFISKSKPLEILKNTRLWGIDLTFFSDFSEKVVKAYEDINNYGIYDALRLCLTHEISEESVIINKSDSVAVAALPLSRGKTALGTKLLEDIPAGHKFAVRDIQKEEEVIKYGKRIGIATQNIKSGEQVHLHNLKTALSGTSEYSYSQPFAHRQEKYEERFFMGYERHDGRIGTRNEIWIVPTVGCINNTAQIIAKKAAELFGGYCDGIFAFSHPYGCSQLGEDGENTAKFLSALCRHPNAGGVVLLGLGCENNNIRVMKKYLTRTEKSRIRFITAQDEYDEISTALEMVGELCRNTSGEIRTRVPLSKLVLGMKCGGSDAFSGITANPLCGMVSDYICLSGGSVILSEVPEMFGAETDLLQRCESKEVFDKAVLMINSFKEYFSKHGEPIYENPSPGNKQGGITTLEEKSLGCIQKGGRSPVTDVLELYGECKKSGLSLLWGPGNDIVSSSNIAAAGATLLLFTTGRGTPFGSFVPTIKISSNSSVANRKRSWIDFDAAGILKNNDFTFYRDELIKLIIETASGEKTKSEQNGYREAAIFKSGITL